MLHHITTNSIILRNKHYPIILILSVLIIPILLSACLIDKIGTIHTPTDYDFNYVGIPERNRSDILDLITGSTYYLDANSGNDSSGNGSSTLPWKTLSRALSIAGSGDGIILRDGDYGDFEETYSPGRASWLVIINEEGANPLFRAIRLHYSQMTDSFLLFYGIKVQPRWVDPSSSGRTGSNDPFYTKSDGDTYAKSADPVHIYKARNVHIYNCVITGTDKNLTSFGVWMNHVSEILIQGNEIANCMSSIQFLDAITITIRNNHCHHMSASCIREGDSKVSDILIEGNHGHDCNTNYGTQAQGGDPWAPRAPNENYHGSAIAMRNGEHIIRNNIFHDGWISSGIMFYEDSISTPPSGAFSNIIIENNLFYDIHNTVITIFKLGYNVLIRNNTIAGYLRDDHPEGVYKYYTTLQIQSVSHGYDASGLKLYNNIFVGGVYLRAWMDNVDESSNIFWSLNDGSWVSDDELTSNSKIITWTSTFPDYFATGFFITDPIFTRGHGSLQDFRLSPTSEGINFGDPTLQPGTSLGSLDEYFFIQNDGAARDTSHCDAGAYQN